MDTLVIMLLVLLPFGWMIYKLIRYSAMTVGDDGPLKQVVHYAYGEDDVLKWSQLSWLLLIVPLLLWVCWVVTNALVHDANNQVPVWAYAVVAMLWVLLGALLFLAYHFFRIEQNLWRMIVGTTLTLNPERKSVTVGRAGDDLELTATNTVLIEHHWLKQGRFGYQFYRFIDSSGRSTVFYDYSKGLPFAIEAYFRGVPYQLVEHCYPFKAIPFN